jgi:hypothetical protein
MLNVYLKNGADGWKVLSCPAIGYRKRFLYYSRRECLQTFRREADLVYKHLNIIEGV